jgi:hypothetical protein
MEGEKFGFSRKFQEFINGGKWQEVKKFLSDYVVGHDVEGQDLAKCYVIVYKVLQNE